MKTIEVRSAKTQDAVLNHQCDIVEQFDTIREAKAFAKRTLTEEYQRLIESSEPIGYAQVVEDGQVIADYLSKAEVNRLRERLKSEQQAE